MVPLARLAIVAGSVWFLGAYLFHVIPKVYYRSDIAFPGYAATLFIVLTTMGGTAYGQSAEWTCSTETAIKPNKMGVG